MEENISIVTDSKRALQTMLRALAKFQDCSRDSFSAMEWMEIQMSMVVVTEEIFLDGKRHRDWERLNPVKRAGWRNMYVDESGKLKVDPLSGGCNG